MRSTKFIAAIVIASFLFVSAAFALHEEIPRISVAELKKMIDTNAPVYVIDAQSKETYDKGHIKGAHSLPWKSEITPGDVENLPKDVLIVTYCDCGPGENDSADTAYQLINLGYPNVKILADPAIKEWKKLGYPMEK